MFSCCSAGRAAFNTGGGGGGGGAVDSVFGRTGVVVAATGDYNTDQITNVSGVAGASCSDALETLAAAIVVTAALIPATAIGEVLYDVHGPSGNLAGIGPTTTKTQADADTTIATQAVLLSNHSLTTSRLLDIDATVFEPGTLIHVVFLFDAGAPNTFQWVTANITEDASAPFAGSQWEDFDASMAIDFRIEFDGANNVARFVGGQLLAQDYSVAFA